MTLIGWVLKVLRLTVLVDLLRDICARNELVLLEIKELSHLIRYRTFLRESRLRGVRIARLTGTLTTKLLRSSLVILVDLLHYLH